MEDTKKQIEEMYQIFLNYRFSMPAEGFSYKGMVENFIDNNYRKINENEVVISKEELDILKDISNLKSKVQEALNANTIEELIMVEREARKEMAEKIIQDLKPLLEGFVHADTGENLYVYKCKQFGVEVEQ